MRQALDMIWSLVACISALGIIAQIGQQTLPRVSSDGLSDLLVDALNYTLNVTLALGTPYLAWHVAVVQGPIRVAALRVSKPTVRILAIQNITAAVAAAWLRPGMLKCTFLWGSTANWWLLGIILLPRETLVDGYWWLRTVLAVKLGDILLKGI